jgi:hypothetical protein
MKCFSKKHFGNIIYGEFGGGGWSIVGLRRFNGKKTSQKIPVVLVELFSEEDAQLLCHMKEYKGLKFEKLV